jgi:hypothetical protein
MMAESSHAVLLTNEGIATLAAYYLSFAATGP